MTTREFKIRGRKVTRTLKVSRRETAEEVQHRLYAESRLPRGFWRRVKLADLCWLWTARGGGRARDDAVRRARRTAYATLIGRIEGRYLGPTCERPDCINPWHQTPRG